MQVRFRRKPRPALKWFCTRRCSSAAHRRRRSPAPRDRGRRLRGSSCPDQAYPLRWLDAPASGAACVTVPCPSCPVARHSCVQTPAPRLRQLAQRKPRDIAQQRDEAVGLMLCRKAAFFRTRRGSIAHGPVGIEVLRDPPESVLAYGPQVLIALL